MRDLAAIARHGFKAVFLAVPVLVATILAGAMIGETSLAPELVLSVLANKLAGADLVINPVDQGIVWSYRLPRAMVAASCGAGLAVAGVVLQALLRNALADPYILGISAGASTGAVAVTIAGLGGGALSLSVGPSTARFWPLVSSCFLPGLPERGEGAPQRHRSFWPASPGLSFSTR